MKAIIMDFDGTLVDSMSIWRGLGKIYLKSLGVVPKKDLRDRLSRLTLEESTVYLIEEYNLDKTSEQVKHEINSILRKRFRELELRPYFLNVLSLFKEQGIRMCIATANERMHIEAFLESNQLEDYFEFILTCSETHTTKMTIDIFDLATEKMNLDRKDVTVVEDALHPIMACRDSGYHVVALYDANEINNIDSIKKYSDEYYYSPEAWYQKLIE